MPKINSKIFKVYDIRGKYPEEINEKVVAKITSVFTDFLKKELKRQKIKFVICRDIRLSSEKLEQAAINSINKNTGIKIIKAGLSTTPMFSFLVKQLKADGGIMITASHNPKEYNGLKMAVKNGLSISGEEIKGLIKSRK